MQKTKTRSIRRPHQTCQTGTTRKVRNFSFLCCHTLIIFFCRVQLLYVPLDIFVSKRICRLDSQVTQPCVATGYGSSFPTIFHTTVAIQSWCWFKWWKPHHSSINLYTIDEVQIHSPLKMEKIGLWKSNNITRIQNNRTILMIIN